RDDRDELFPGIVTRCVVLSIEHSSSRELSAVPDDDAGRPDLMELLYLASQAPASTGSVTALSSKVFEGCPSGLKCDGVLAGHVYRQHVLERDYKGSGRIERPAGRCIQYRERGRFLFHLGWMLNIPGSSAR